MSAIGSFRLTTGGVELDPSPERFGFLQDSNDALNDHEALRARMERDGYLFLPGFLDRDDVREARVAICRELAAEDLLEPGMPVELAIAKPGIDMSFRPDIANGHGAGVQI